MLYVVATPLGNLKDITLRALEVLGKVNLILAEDTRTARRLLSHYNIHTKLISLHQYSSSQKIDWIIAELKRGRKIALISEAGTPCISDPGYRLLSLLPSRVKRVPIPGPSALTAAASICGLGVSKFLFLGFLPRKKRRRQALEKIKSSEFTVIFYESPYRIKRTLAELQKIIDNRKVCVCRELTKVYETIYYGEISEVIEEIEERGEFVVVVEGRD